MKVIKRLISKLTQGNKQKEESGTKILIADITEVAPGKFIVKRRGEGFIYSPVKNITYAQVKKAWGVDDA